MKNKTIRLMIALLLGLFASGAIAANGNVYGALDIGQGTAKDACTGLPSSISCTDTVAAYRVALGYQFNDNFSVEGSYSPEATINASGTYLGTSISADESFSAFQFSVIGAYPVTGDFSLLGKVGMALIDAKATATGLTSVSYSNNNTNLAYGVGVKFAIIKQLAIRVMYEDFGSVKTSNTSSGGNVTYLSAGLQFGF